jgi:hypothetical protein
MMVPIDIDPKKLTKKRGLYLTGKAADLADPAFHSRAQEYKRTVSLSTRALSAQDIGRLPKARGLYVTRKYDGEFALIGFDGERLVSVNPGGTVRIGLPCYQEAEKLLKKAKVTSCLLAGELYIPGETNDALRIHQVVSILRSPSSEKELERLGLAVFDVLEFDDEHPDSISETFTLLKKWFGKGKLVHPVEHIVTDSIDKVFEKFADWVIGESSEGIVVRHDKVGTYKIKARHNLDVAIIGFSEGADQRKGMLHDLLVAVVRKDGTFHELARVGGGFSDEDRREFVKLLKKRIVTSDYVAVNNDYVAYEMVKPGPVIEISCLDMITERARGGPVNRMVLDWNGKRYSALSRMPLVSVISPQFVRIRDDKEAGPEDTAIHQVTDLAAVQEVERSADPSTRAPSELIERQVYVKEMHGNTMVRKLFMWKTNKEETGEFPAFVVYLTDFSPNRQTPLERDIKVAGTKAAAERLFKEMASKNFVKGWEEAS